MHCEIATALKVQYYTHRKRPVEGSRIFCSASRPSSQDCSAASHTRLLLYTLAVRRALPRMEELRFKPENDCVLCLRLADDAATASQSPTMVQSMHCAGSQQPDKR